MRVVYVGWQCGMREVALRLGTFLLAHAEHHRMLDVLHVFEMLLLVRGERGSFGGPDARCPLQPPWLLFTWLSSTTTTLLDSHSSQPSTTLVDRASVS
jgi:hypothetical protein